jgi:hypothetical protein
MSRRQRSALPGGGRPPPPGPGRPGAAGARAAWRRRGPGGPAPARRAGPSYNACSRTSRLGLVILVCDTDDMHS